MIDWRTVEWWDLPGPSRFIERVASTILTDGQGGVGLLLPLPRPEGLLAALSRRLSEASASIPMQVDASGGLRGRSPAHLLASAVGPGAGGIRSVAGFLDAPGLAEVAFVVDGISPDEWMTWGIFLRALRAECARRPRAIAPTVCLVLPNAVPPDDVRAALGGCHRRWMGAVSRIDTQLHAERLIGWPGDDLASQTAVSTVVELAGWDPSVVLALARLPLEEQLDPRVRQAGELAQGAQPCWANGLVDHWDGQVHVHTNVFLATGDAAALSRRLWRGHVRTLYPFLEQVRHAFAAKYEERLRALLPITKTYHTRVETYSDPFDLELYDLFRLLRDNLPRREATLLLNCYKLRTLMAHMTPAEALVIVRVSRLWEELRSSFPDGCYGWDWPRCGQKLVVMVGPGRADQASKGGSHSDPADIVSSGLTPEDPFGNASEPANQEQLFACVRQEVESGSPPVAMQSSRPLISRIGIDW